jgi:hypothetical protein
VNPKNGMSSEDRADIAFGCVHACRSQKRQYGSTKHNSAEIPTAANLFKYLHGLGLPLLPYMLHDLRFPDMKILRIGDICDFECLTRAMTRK